MADVNYVNPSSLDPGVGFKPDGFLGGMEWQKRNQMFNDAQSLQQLMSTVGARKAVGELGEWEKDAPIREAKGLADLATHNAVASTVGRLKEAEVGDINARISHNNALTKRSEYDLSELQAPDVERTRRARMIAENVAKAGEAGVAGLQNAIKGAQLAAIQVAQSGGGPQAAAVAFKALASAGIPQEQAVQIIGDGNPATIMKNLKSMTDMLMLVDTHHQSEMAKVREQGASHERVAGISAAATRYAADQRSAAKKQSAKQILTSKMTPEQAQRAAELIYHDPDTDAETKLLAETVWKRAKEQITNAAKVKNPQQLTDKGPAPITIDQAPLDGFATTPNVIDFSKLPK